MLRTEKTTAKVLADCVWPMAVHCACLPFTVIMGQAYLAGSVKKNLHNFFVCQILKFYS